MNVELHFDTTHIARIVIDNPAHRNALTLSMWVELAEAARRISRDREVRVVVLTGSGGRAFSSGADISQFQTMRACSAQVKTYNSAIVGGMEAIYSLDVPVVAQIHGSCVGGGVALALMCDMRIMEAGGTFGIPAGKLGIAYLPDWIKRLTDVVGPGAAGEIFYTAGIFPSERAAAWGFANELVPKGNLDARVDEIAARIASLAPLTLRAAKASIRQSLEHERGNGWAHALALSRLCDESRDYERGVAAFLAGKPAIFKGN